MSIVRNLVNYAGITAGLVGELKMWSTGTAPKGYLICDGSAVSRTTYADLFAAIGTTFGSGNGSTTFNLPDYRDTMPIGAGNLYNINAKGGSRDAIVVSHSHSATDSGHSHQYRDLGYGQGNGNFTGSSGSWSGNGGSTSAASTSTANISVSTAGSDGTNANLPPYTGIHFIIRYLA